MKTMQALKRVLAVCLIAVFALQPGSLAVAETVSGTGIISSDAAHKLPAEEITLLRADELPENVSYAEAVEKQFVERMHDEEPNLHTVVLRHADNTRTMIVENHPVKYVDSTGKIQDKSLKIERNPNASKTEYRTKSNDVQTTFAGTLSGGIRLQHDGVDIRMTPYTADSGKVTASPSAVLSSDSKRITYALSEKVRYDYELTYMGFKEDIVLTEYTGQTDFVFTLHTNGLHPVQIDGSWFLCDDTEAIRATIGDIIIFTADERNNAFGSLTVETVTANQEYRMTIHVDAEYLTDEKTLYPIRIDPTIEVNSSDGTRAIEDVTLNSTAVSAPASTSLYIGNRQNYGKTRILMKFPGLDLSDVTQSSAITSATVEIRDLMCESESMSISVHTFTGNTWSETDSDWSSPADWSKVSPNSYVTTAMDTKSVSYSNGAALTTPHRYAFNIKPAVQGWVSGDYNQNKGIIFKSNGIEGTTTYQKKTFSSFNRSSYQPSIKVTYQNPTTPEEPEEPEEPQNPSADSIIGKESSSLLVGSTEDLLTEASVTATWTSSDPSVATVSYGVVTAIKPGTTTICATLDTGESDSCEITVCGASIYSLMQGKKFYLYNEDTENTLTVSLSNLGICDYITGMNDQMWTLTEVSAEYNLYHIATELSSRANAPYLTESQLLNVSCGPTSDSAVWYFKSAGDGRYYIVCASSGRYLTASTDKGTNAYLSEENSSTVQKWEMIVKFEEGDTIDICRKKTDLRNINILLRCTMW